MPNVGENSRVVVEYFLILLLYLCFSFLLVASLVRVLVHCLKIILCDALVSNKRRTPNISAAPRTYTWFQALNGISKATLPSGHRNQM